MKDYFFFGMAPALLLQRRLMAESKSASQSFAAPSSPASPAKREHSRSHPVPANVSKRAFDGKPFNPIVGG
jgi:hypothetical protein